MPPPASPAREGAEDNGDIPPAFHEDLSLREMKASFKSNKGTLTRLSHQVKVRAETFIAIKSPESASHIISYHIMNNTISSWLSATSYIARPTNWR